MTRRERLERRAERRREWADSRARKSAAGFERARVVADGIPMGQPILVGHHSERHHRADVARIDAGMRQGCESADMASHHASKAAGIEDQLERSIFSDDDGAAESCEAKADALDARRDLMKRANAMFRKASRGSSDPIRAGLLAVTAECGDEIAQEAARNLGAWRGVYVAPFPSYCLTNNSGNARRYRQRAGNIRAEAQRQATAEAAPGGIVITRHPDYDVCSVRFAEKPERDIIDALKAAGFCWGAGAWSGATSKLPAAVAEMVPA